MRNPNLQARAVRRECLFRDPLQRVPRPLGDLLDVDLNVVPVKHHPVFLVIRNLSRRTLRLVQLLEVAMKLVGSRLETVPRVHNRLNTARKFGNRSRAVNRLRRGRLREQCIHTQGWRARKSGDVLARILQPVPAEMRMEHVRANLPPPREPPLDEQVSGKPAVSAPTLTARHSQGRPPGAQVSFRELAP